MSCRFRLRALAAALAALSVPLFAADAARSQCPGKGQGSSGRSALSAARRANALRSLQPGAGGARLTAGQRAALQAALQQSTSLIAALQQQGASQAQLNQALALQQQLAALLAAEQAAGVSAGQQVPPGR